MKTDLIKLRIDVDYPYPSRMRSFIYTATGIKISGKYKNPKMVAQQHKIKYLQEIMHEPTMRMNS